MRRHIIGKNLVSQVRWRISHVSVGNKVLVTHGTTPARLRSGSPVLERGRVYKYSVRLNFSYERGSADFLSDKLCFSYDPIFVNMVNRNGQPPKYTQHGGYPERDLRMYEGVRENLVVSSFLRVS